MTKLFVPNSTDLHCMIAAAEAKFNTQREHWLRARAERAFCVNAQAARLRRDSNARRYVMAGDKP